MLNQYDFAIQFRQGKKQLHCDALSRCENPRTCDCPLLQDTNETLECRISIKRAQDIMHEKVYKEARTSPEVTDSG